MIIDKHINILENLYKNHDYVRADNYLESIDKLISEFVLTSYTTHPVLNLILNEKKRIAEKILLLLAVLLNTLILILWKILI